MSKISAVEGITIDKDGQKVIIHDADEAKLAALGKKQEMARNFNIFSMLGMCFCIIATWEALSSIMAPGLTSGGSVAILYGYIAAAIGAGFVAASLSEIGSIWPTSGGQYHWAAELSPPRMRPLISWYAGWLSNAALWLSCLSAGFAAATQINAYIIVCNPDYVPQRYHTVFIFWAILILGVVINVFGIKFMHGLNIGAMIIHGCGFICVIVVMSVMGSHHDAAFVFTSFENLSGWSSNGVAWCLGLLTTSYGFVGYDAAAHMSEEMKNASRDMPRAMFGSVVVSGILTFPYIIALLFAIGDIDDLLASPTGSPITQLFVNVTGSNAGGIALNCIITIIATVATTDFLASCSRTTWAFARDNGIPFPKFFAHVSPRWNVPVNAIVLAATLQALLACIFIGNTTAFNAFIALSTVGINLSYCLPVFLYLVYGRWYLKPEKGPFNLGRFGPAINFVAVCWTLFLTIFLMFPSYQPVTPENMNYAVVILAFVFVFATVLWFAWGRKVYTGPVTEVVGMENFIEEEFRQIEYSTDGKV